MKTTNLNKALSQSLKKYKVLRKDLTLFKKSLQTCLENIAIAEEKKEHEENFKNHLADFFKKSLFQEHLINTKERIDLAIYSGKDAKSHINVLIEVKRPSNVNEFLSEKSINKKALHELLLYYLRERVDKKNNNIKHLIATNGYEWYLFKGEDFYTHFYKNTALRKEYEAFRDGQKDSSKNELFYSEIAKKYIEQVGENLDYVYFNLKDYQEFLNPEPKKENIDENKFITLYKILSANHLLNKSFGNDSNQLNKQFYEELLHIVGLEEVKNKGKKVIQRLGDGKRNYGSLLESAIFTLEEKDYLRKVPKIQDYGQNQEEQVFNIALELCLTWINRILFIKLLESQLLNYHDGNKKYRFVHRDFIAGFDDLEALFFSALAKKHKDRNPRYKEKYQYIPYLNSSLFEANELEDKVMQISNIKNENLIFHHKTILKDNNNKTLKGQNNTLAYLFDFLNAYDFGSDSKNQIEEGEQSKTLMSASVLGLIFEKINGYKDGSFYTPSYITMYMSRETLRRAVIQKMNAKYAWKCSNFADLKEDLKDHIREQTDRNKSRLEANKIMNTLRICDPAVGSGHFLVSCLNELIAIKSELKILCDVKGERLPVYITLENDELIIENENGEEFKYLPQVERTHKVQKALFHEKQTLIENCLFAVDINPNSVKICRLRLWIELLKNAYYTQNKELQTLPNIDINIKCGNSLISRFDLQDELKSAFNKKNNPYTLQDYKNAVHEYKNTNDKNRKREIQKIIETIKNAFKTSLDTKFKKKIAKARGKYEFEQLEIKNLKAFGTAIPKKKLALLKKAKTEYENALAAKEDILTGAIYQNAFEWRFEFPEVLDKQGNFTGFDVVIGNPPYGVSIKGEQRKHLIEDICKVPDYEIYYWFIERASQILKVKGNVSYIIPNTILFNVFAQDYRANLFKKWSINEILDCTDLDIFEEATVRTIIFQFQKEGEHNSLFFKKTNDLKSFNEFNDRIIESIDKETALANNQNWSLIFKLDKSNLKLISKIKKSTVSLNNYFPEISQGLIAYDKYKGQSEKIIKGRAYHSIKKTKKTHKKWLHGRDVRKYSVIWNGKEYIEYDKGIANPRDPKYFIGKRILIREITNPTIFASITNLELYNDPSILIIKDNEESFELEILLAILNSKLATFYHFNSSPKATKGAFPKILVYDIKNFPLPKSVDNKLILNNVKQILKLKEENPQADTSKLEAQIDALVYQLYELSDEEIGIIEGG